MAVLTLDEKTRDEQIVRGLYVTERGERFAIPVDSLRNRETYQNRDVWRQDERGVYRAGTRFTPFRTTVHNKVLSFLRDKVHPNIPRLYYTAVLGHDLHVSTWAELYGRQWHAGWANPFEPDRLEFALDEQFQTLKDTHWVDHVCDLSPCPASIYPNWKDALAALPKFGFTENLGLLSQGKVTTAFVSEEIDELVSTTGTEYADFDYHEVGTSSTAESNAHTALQTSTGIARATGTPTDSDPIYQSVGTITADTTETWAEHGLFNNSSGVAMMDRSLTGGQSVNSSDQVQYTYQLTKNAEA